MGKSLEMRRKRNLDAFDEVNEINRKDHPNNSNTKKEKEDLEELFYSAWVESNVNELEKIEDVDKAAVDAARQESAGIAKLLSESEMLDEELWSASDLGKYTINTPVQEKQKAEEQDKYMQPISELEFQGISADVDREDAEMQKKLEEIAKELEGTF